MTKPGENASGSNQLSPLMARAIHAHRQGKLAEARQLYEQLLVKQPDLAPARHNLGMVMVGLGMLRDGVALVEQVMLHSGPFPEQAASCRELGMVLYRHGYWEHAREWLERAAALTADAAPHPEVEGVDGRRKPSQAVTIDPELQAILQRLAPRGYLQPEVYDPLADEILLRYSPREAQHYVYVVEVVASCNLSCPSCPVGNYPPEQRAHRRGMMSYALFSEILAKIEREKPAEQVEIWLFNWGEPLLHPELSRFISAIRERGMICQLSSNLNIPKGIDEVIAAGPDMLKISLSSWLPQLYGQCHRGGKLALVKSNMYRIRYALDRYQSGTRVWLGHHHYRSSAGEAEMLQGICRELGFAYQPIPAYFQPIEHVMALADGSRQAADFPILADLPVAPQDVLAHRRAHRTGEYDCELRFNQTVINSDGSVALCCNVFEEQNMLGVQFLETPAARLEELKYNHPCCRRCRQLGADYSVASLLPERLG